MSALACVELKSGATSADGVPTDNDALRQALYAGKIYRFAASPASLKLVAAAVALLDVEFTAPGSTDAGKIDAHRKLQFGLSPKELFERMGKVRKAVPAAAELQALVFDLIAELGFDGKANALDPARLRAVSHLGHENPLAAPAYTAHRDTWYANPQAQINWWMPLHDVGEGETFEFFPDYFIKPVENDSQDFDYDQWMAQVGWQSTNGAKAVYPAAGASFAGIGPLPFGCKAGEVILFAAAQVHQTVKNVSGLMRLSVDFRTVHLDDHAKGVGAPNVDNLSTGCSLVDYKRL
jgi:hypothetical protein